MPKITVKLSVSYDDLPHNERKVVRNRYIKLQNNLCYYCKEALTRKPKAAHFIDWALFPKGFLKYPIHLHHSHITGRTVGVVHAYCNAVLWQYHKE